MPMTRAQAAAYVGRRHYGLLIEAGMAATDDDGNLGAAIDGALLAMGIDYDDIASATVESADAEGYRRLLTREFYRTALERLRGIDVSLGDPNVSKRYSQRIEQVERWLAQAAKDAAPYDANNASGWQVSARDSLGVYEPEPVL